MEGWTAGYEIKKMWQLLKFTTGRKEKKKKHEWKAYQHSSEVCAFQNRKRSFQINFIFLELWTKSTYLSTLSLQIWWTTNRKLFSSPLPSNDQIRWVWILLLFFLWNSISSTAKCVVSTVEILIWYYIFYKLYY